MNEEITAYSFSVEIFKTEDGKFGYGVFQDFESEDKDELNLQLLETGGADTLVEAATMASDSIKTLFVV
jgi:hypothetical protein